MKRLVPLLLSSLLFACIGEEFTPYKEIDRLRVLAVGSNKPWLMPTETATLSALVVQDAADTSPVTYEWAWCPLTAGSDQGFECAFSHDDLQARIDMDIGEGVLVIPPYELGTSTTATFAYDLPPIFFEGTCAGIRMLEDVPDFITLPDCEGTFPITISLRVRTETEEVFAIKEIEMVYDTSITAVNTNPIIEAVAAKNPLEMDARTLSSTAATELARTTKYELQLSVPNAASETYGDGIRENLVASWFVDKDSGDLDRTRTSYFEGEIPFENLLMNEWETAKAVNYPDTNARLFVVLRDERRGVTWTSRRITLR